MTELNDERWAFMVEWFDSSADLVRQYQLLYYLMDSTLEMSVPASSVRAVLLSARPAPVAPRGRASNPWARAHRYDIKNRRTLLKRSDYPAVTPAHLFIGSELTVYSRKGHKPRFIADPRYL